MGYEYLEIPFVEIEVRLGTVKKINNREVFDSSIDKLHFQKINQQLSESKWNAIEDTHTVEYYSDDSVKENSGNNGNNGNNGNKENTRLIENQVTNKLILTSKENILTKTFQLSNSPFDVRFSVNQEFLLNNYIETFSKTDCFVRDKKRKSYISDNFKYDLTYVIQNKNNIKKEKYELEIELLQNDETVTWSREYVNDFIECKIYDLINITEPMKRESLKINLI